MGQKRESDAPVADILQKLMAILHAIRPQIRADSELSAPEAIPGNQTLQNLSPPNTVKQGNPMKTMHIH